MFCWKRLSGQLWTLALGPALSVSPERALGRKAAAGLCHDIVKLELRLSQRKGGSTFLLCPWKAANQGKSWKQEKGLVCSAVAMHSSWSGSLPGGGRRFLLLSTQKIDWGREGLSYGEPSISDLAQPLLAVSSGGCSGDYFVFMWVALGSFQM